MWNSLTRHLLKMLLSWTILHSKDDLLELCRSARTFLRALVVWVVVGEGAVAAEEEADVAEALIVEVDIEEEEEDIIRLKNEVQ